VASAYGRHGDSQLAAAISYRVLFSLVPFVALLAAVLDLVLSQSAQEDVVHWLFGAIPGSELEAYVDSTLKGRAVSASVVGLFALLVLLWAASSMMASVRTALRLVWEAPAGRSFARGKLLDAALVVFTGSLVVVAFGLSVVSHVAVSAGSDVTTRLGWDGSGRVFGAAAEIACSLLVAFAAFLLVYRVVPPVDLSIADVWPAALFAAVAFQLIIAGFSFYLAHIASYSAVYGSLGAVFGFLVLVYLLAAVLLLGAEITRVIRH
jgi:membrane protein